MKTKKWTIEKDWSGGFDIWEEGRELVIACGRDEEYADIIRAAPEMHEALKNTLSALKSQVGPTASEWPEVQEAERVLKTIERTE